MRSRLGIICMILGVLLVLSAVGLSYYNHWDEDRADESSQGVLDQLNVQILSHEQDSSPSQNMDPYGEDDVSDEARSGSLVPGPDGHLVMKGGISFEEDTYMGVLQIPALGLSLPVNQDWSYPKLRVSPCRFRGGIDDSLVIMAHNYKRHFGDISTLSYGDEVFLVDAEGVVHYYTVVEVEKVMPSEVRKVIDSEYELTLFTCTYGGASRYVVRCTKEE